MKILKFNEKTGMMTVIPHSPDDIYALYLTIKPGDIVIAKTTRRISASRDEMDKPGRTSRETIILGVKVESVDLAGLADSLRIKGTIVEGPEDKVSYGSYHTIVPALNERLTIKKDEWSREDLRRLQEAEEVTNQKPLLLIAMDQDEASIALVRVHVTRILDDLVSFGARKIHDVKQHAVGRQEFFEIIRDTLIRHIKKYDPEVIVLAGPGFVKQGFYEYLMKKNKELKEQVILLDTNMAGRSGISEIISRKLPQRLADKQRAVYEARYINEVLYHLGKEDGLVTYGFEEIKRAAELGAINVLLLLDKEFSESIEKRQSWEVIIEMVKKTRGKAVIVSSLHDAGKQLEGIGGSAALLRYRLP